MRDVLVRIKRAVLAGNYAFSEKARMEMEADGITELDVIESIINSVAIYKRIRSRVHFVIIKLNIFTLFKVLTLKD